MQFLLFSEYYNCCGNLKKNEITNNPNDSYVWWLVSGANRWQSLLVNYHMFLNTYWLLNYNIIWSNKAQYCQQDVF